MRIKDLENNGIFISDEPARDGALPQHIDRVRTGLLDFTWTVADGVDDVDDEGEIHHDRLDDRLLVLESADLHTTDRTFIKAYKDIREDARILHEGKDREAEWQTFFLINFFRPLVDAVRMKDGDTRHTARAKFYYEYFESAQSRPWSLFGQNNTKGRKGFRQDDRGGLTEPKPDWVAFFPIYAYAGERIPRSRRWPLIKDPKKRITENFLHATLEHLAQHGVESNTAGLFRRRRKGIVLSDGVCFPWLIVEHKKAGQTALKEKCYCQAANAGTAAVMMLETLSDIVPRVEAHKANEHIPPVVTITTLDRIVRIWITYSCKPSANDAAKYRMDCIWKGDMTYGLDLIKFRAILENTHTWAVREQRPRISTYIDLWKSKHPMAREAQCQPTPCSAILTEPASTPATEVVDVFCLESGEPSSLVPSFVHMGIRSPSPTPSIEGHTAEAGNSSPDQDSPAEHSAIEQEPGSEKELESEDDPSEEDQITGGKLTREQSIFEEPVSEAELTREQPAAMEKPIREEPISEEEWETVSEEEPISEEEPVSEEPTTWEKSTWEEQCRRINQSRKRRKS